MLGANIYSVLSTHRIAGGMSGVQDVDDVGFDCRPQAVVLVSTCLLNRILEESGDTNPYQDRLCFRHVFGSTLWSDIRATRSIRSFGLIVLKNPQTAGGGQI